MPQSERDEGAVICRVLISESLPAFGIEMGGGTAGFVSALATTAGAAVRLAGRSINSGNTTYALALSAAISSVSRLGVTVTQY
jgi:hypothetical protein